LPLAIFSLQGIGRKIVLTFEGLIDKIQGLDKGGTGFFPLLKVLQGTLKVFDRLGLVLLFEQLDKAEKRFTEIAH
jgi:hypothetical protein